MYLSPNWMLSRVRSVKEKKKRKKNRNSLSRAHRGVLVPTSLFWFPLPIDSLPFATVVFWLHFFLFFSERKSMERKLLCQLFTATNWSTLARHALKLICQTTLIQFCSSRYWAMRVSCLVTSRRSRDQNVGFSAADDADARSAMFVFIQINTFTYLRKMSIKRTAWMLNFIYIVQSKLYLRLKISVQGPFNSRFTSAFCSGDGQSPSQSVKPVLNWANVSSRT